MAQGWTLINYILSLPFFVAFPLPFETRTSSSLELKANSINLLSVGMKSTSSLPAERPFPLNLALLLDFVR